MNGVVLQFVPRHGNVDPISNLGLDFVASADPWQDDDPDPAPRRKLRQQLWQAVESLVFGAFAGSLTFATLHGTGVLLGIDALSLAGPVFGATIGAMACAGNLWSDED